MKQQQISGKKRASLFSFLIDAPIRLTQVRRFATLPVIRPESIPEHSHMVAVISYLLAVDMKADPGEAVIKAIFHDYEEAITGDICRDFKYLDKGFHSALNSIEPAVVKSICQNLPKELGEVLETDWQDAKDNSLEGWIVEVADSIAVMIYIYEEAKLGNTWLLDKPWKMAFPVAMKKLKAIKKYSSSSLAENTMQDFQKWHKQITGGK